MAAPSGIKWGSTVGDYGKIGIYVKLTTTDTQVERHIEVWFASKYSVSDTSNTVYWDCGANVTSASTSRGSVSINHTVDTGSGWSTSNQTKIYSGDYTYTRGTSDATYKCYAKFSGIDTVGGTMSANTTFTVPAKVQTYTVKYDANGGSGAPSAQTKTHGVALTLSSTKPTRTGYTFKCWNKEKDGSGTTNFNPGGTYTGNADVTFYAQWTPKTYTISFNANGGSGAPSAQTKTHGVTLTLSSTKPTRTNYTFQGWGTSASATSASYQPGSGYTGNADATLYAVWKANSTTPTTYTVSLTKGTGISSVSGNGSYAAGASVTINATVTSGYTWNNWTGYKTTTTQKYTFTMPSQNVSFTANATKNAATTYTVTLNKGTGISAVTGAGSYEAGKTVTINATVSSGYTWKNWTGYTTTTTKNYSFTMPSQNVTLTANATANSTTPATYTISYNANGGSGAPASQTKTENVTLTLSSTKPTRSGYTFKNWNTNQYGYGTSYSPGGSYTANASATLYAQWEQNASTEVTYTIAYTLNGGTKGTYAPTSATVGDWFQVSNPTRSGYTFKGWNITGMDSTTHNYGSSTLWGYSSSTATSLNNITVTNFKNLRGSAGTVTFAAQWEQTTSATTYTVSYNANGGSGAPGDQIKTHNVTLTLSSTKPTRTGFTFVGWGTSETATTASYQPGGSYTTNANLTLFAIWKEVAAAGKVYICSDGKVYATDFINAGKISIDTDGNLYATAFITGTSFSISSKGFITATAFVKGTP